MVRGDKIDILVLNRFVTQYCRVIAVKDQMIAIDILNISSRFCCPFVRTDQFVSRFLGQDGFVITILYTRH